MISNAFRRVTTRSRNIAVATGQVNDYIARSRLFSSSLREKTETNGEFIGGTSASEVVSYPATDNSSSEDNVEYEKPVLLNSKEHVVGYLNRILNARVYEAAVETDLQYAENLSTVSWFINLWNVLFVVLYWRIG